MLRLDKTEVKDLRPCNKEELLEFDPKEFNPETVARHHREMFRLHDLKDWDNLKNKAREMIVALGYNREDAEKASEFVLQAYRDADRAKTTQKTGKHDEEQATYNKMLTNFIKASKSLQSETKSIKYKIGWYKWERHNKPFLVAYYLFRQHLKRFGILRLDIVIRTTWVAFFGGYYAHNKHDWEKLEKALIKYWRHVKQIYSIRPPLEI